jgi:hypothetical protein
LFEATKYTDLPAEATTIAIMKFLSATALLLASPLVAAASLPALFDPSQAPIRAAEDTRKNPVDGNNPLEFCEPPSSHLLTIDSVDLSPNPPQP